MPSPAPAPPSDRAFEFVAAGELLVDLVASERQTPLSDAAGFSKLFGGAPANVAVNMQRLGVRSTIVSRVGNDGLGTFLTRKLTALGIDPRHVKRDPSAPTSLVVVTSGETPPEFVAYREADTELRPEDVPQPLIRDCKVFHTTAHSIARDPTRSTILGAFRKAHELGKWTSFDPNYSQSFWPDRDEALEVIRTFVSCTTFCKPSLDDCERLFGTRREAEYLETLHGWGAENVILTRGEDGAVFSRRDAEPRAFEAIEQLQPVDPTGAGDAFTAGFLAGYLRTADVDRSMHAGLRAASFKLRHVGGVAPLPPLQELLAD